MRTNSPSDLRLFWSSLSSCLNTDSPFCPALRELLLLLSFWWLSATLASGIIDWRPRQPNLLLIYLRFAWLFSRCYSYSILWSALEAWTCKWVGKYIWKTIFIISKSFIYILLKLLFKLLIEFRNRAQRHAHPVLIVIVSLHCCDL